MGECGKCSSAGSLRPSAGVGLRAEIDDLRWTGYANRLRRLAFDLGFLEAVLNEQIHVVPAVEDLALDVWMMFLELSHLPILLGHKFLAHGCYLDVQVVLGEIEIRCEVSGRLSTVVPLDGECLGFKLPINRVKIQETRKLAFAVVCELGRIGR